MNRLSAGLRVVLSAPVLLLFLTFFLAPILLMLRYSFGRSDEMRLVLTWTTANYGAIASDPIYLTLLARSIGVAALVSVLAVLVGFPAAWVIARAPERRRTLLLVLLVVPWWASYIVRVFAWYSLFGNSGVINRSLDLLGMVDAPVTAFTFGLPAVIVTELNLYLPLTVIPIYMALERLDWTMVAAARSLGAGPFTTFRRIVLPFSVPGIIAGLIFVFMPVSGTFVVPELVGGTSGLMIGKVIASQFGGASNWPLGAALSTLLLGTLLVVLGLLTQARRRLAGEQFG